MEYISAKEAAEKWYITQRRVSVLCKENRIPNVLKLGNMWLIPKYAHKPVDRRTLRYTKEQRVVVTPFVKWAGGKSQLLKEIQKTYPSGLGKTITKYAEPFVGGGAVLFDILSKYDLDKVYISDINSELINSYRMIRDNINGLLDLLKQYQSEYHPISTDERKEFYYEKRDRFNELKVNGDSAINLESAALFIFLNKTCFNGLYRVNRRNLFNVPMGAYKKPLICDEENLRNISKALRKVTIVCDDYRKSAEFIDDNTFVYFDPPYRPLNETSNFTAYTENVFDDKAQIELAQFVQLMDEKGASVVVSNSDPKNINEDDDFFDSLYARHQINRVEATRMINSKSDQRGKISELLICNL